MTPTNTRESGLESLIVNWLVEHNGYEQGASSEKRCDGLEMMLC
jgi:type I restriction enzyme R subunit